MGVREEQVFGLEVPMADAAVVAVAHSGQELAEVVPRRAFVRAAVDLRQDRRRFAAVGGWMWT